MGTLFSTINCFDNTQFCKSNFEPLFFSEHALRGARCVFYCFFFRKITPNHLQNKMHISFILEGGLRGSCHFSAPAAGWTKKYSFSSVSEPTLQVPICIVGYFVIVSVGNKNCLQKRKVVLLSSLFWRFCNGINALCSS